MGDCLGHPSAARTPTDSHLGTRGSRHGLGQSMEDDEQPLSARIDDTGQPERFKHRWCALQRLLRSRDRFLEHRESIAAAIPDRLRCPAGRVGCLADHREDGALDRVRD